MRPTAGGGCLTSAILKHGRLVHAGAVALFVSCSGGSGTSDTAAPSGKVLFPPPASSTEAGTVRVRGAARGGGGVTSVRVNGVAATTDDGFTSWQATVPLAFGSNDLRVEVEDQAGHRASASGGSIERGAQLLNTQELDVAANGASAVAIDRGLLGLVEVSLTGGARRLVSNAATGSGPDFASPVSVALDVGRGRAFVLDVARDELTEVELASGARRTAALLGLDPSDPDLGSARLDLDVESGQVFVANPGGSVLQVDPETGGVRVVSGPDVGSGPPLEAPMDIAVDASARRLFVLDALARVVTIDIATGARTLLVDLANATNALVIGDIALDSLGGELLGLGSYLDDQQHLVAAVFAFDVQSGTRRIAWQASVREPGLLVNPRRIEINPADGRLVVLDGPDVARFVALDPATGVLEELAYGGAGRGPRLGPGQGIALDETASTAFVVVERECLVDCVEPDFSVVEVDLATGARRRLGDPEQLAEIVSIGNIGDASFDVRHRRVVFTSRGFEGLMAFNLATERMEFYPSVATPELGPPFDLPIGAAVDGVADRVYVCDEREDPRDVLVAVDLTTGTRTIVSSLDRGTGPSLSEPRALAVDPASGEVYVLTQFHSRLLAVDPASGDRTLLMTPSSSGPEPVAPQSLALDAAAHRVLLADAGLVGLLELDLDTGARRVLSSGDVGEGPAWPEPERDMEGLLGLDFDAERGIAYVASMRLEAVLAVDPVTGDRVFVAR